MGQKSHVESSGERPPYHRRVSVVIEHVEHLGLDRRATDPEIVPDGRKTRRVSARQDETRAASGIEPGDFRGDGGSGADDQHPGVGVSSPLTLRQKEDENRGSICRANLSQAGKNALKLSPLIRASLAG